MKLISNFRENCPGQTEKQYQESIREATAELLSQINPDYLQAFDNTGICEQLALLFLRLAAKDHFGRDLYEIVPEIEKVDFSPMLEEMDDLAFQLIRTLRPGFPLKNEIVIQNNKRVG